MKKILPIVMAIHSEKEISLLFVLLQSIADHLNQNYFYECTVLSGYRILKLNNELFHNFQTKNMNVSCLNIASTLSIRMPRYAKEYALIPKLFSKYEKVLYLDLNTLVRSDLVSLFETNLKNFLLAGVVDHGDTTYVEEHLSISGENYINDGVLLFNIPECIKKDFATAFLKKIKKYDKHFPAQDTLNKIAQGQIKLLPYVYNYQQCWFSQADQTDLIFDAQQVCILNYSYYKPYISPELELMDLWWKVARKTPFYEVLLEKLVGAKPISDESFSLMGAYLKGILHWLFSFGSKRRERKEKLHALAQEIQQRILG